MRAREREREERRERLERERNVRMRVVAGERTRGGGSGREDAKFTGLNDFSGPRLGLSNEYC
jgi:hypothetical protein